MQPSFLRTLTGKTLIGLAAGGAAVLLLLATAFGTYLLYRQLEDQAMQRLSSQAAERARVAERVLSHNVETLEALRSAFVDQWPGYQDAAALRRFPAIMALYPDGEWRSRKEISDGRRYPTGWISKRSDLSDDLRRRFVLFFDLAQRYGPGGAIRRDNLFFVSIPEQGNIGQGASFTVYLPSHSTAPPPVHAAESLARGRGETILLVDDEEALARLGEELLAELGYEPVGFTSGAAALAAFRAAPRRFSAVLSDEAMSGMAGSVQAREIRRLSPGIPIVLMTGFATPALHERAQEAGVSDILAKPLVSRDIARSLARVLRRP